jgi:arabinofuranosyltransferase
VESLRGQTGRRISAVAALVPLVVLAVEGWGLRWVADDAFINFRVVDQIAHGNGPVFNHGERVEAYTSTLWLGILWFGSAVLGIQIEWLSVVLGLLLSVAGLAAACWASALVARDRGADGLLLPLGALVFAVLAATWEFATSGLETGLSFAWLGAGFLVLARTCLTELAPSRRRLALAAVLLGLGPLVRPDFAVFSLAFVGVLLVVHGRAFPGRRLALFGVAAAAPLLYEVFRMGYFASLVPNTAIAKEASGNYWGQGLAYLWDFVGTYWLWLPLAALLAWAWVLWRDDRRAGDRGRALVVAAPVVAGIVHVLFVVKVGGDFMHGRMLLPGTFAVLMPVAMVSVPLRRGALGLAAVVALWALVCGIALRVPFSADAVTKGAKIVDERSYYVRVGARRDNPITLDDYSRDPWVRSGREMRKRAAAHERVVTFKGPNFNAADEAIPDTPMHSGLPVDLVAPSSNVGLFGYAAGTDVWVVDRLGIADPIAAREKLERRGRVGHEKVLPALWVIARFSDLAKLPGGIASQPELALTEQALSCSVWIWDGTGKHVKDPLRRLLAEISQPISAGRFLSNVSDTVSGGRFRLPLDPLAARAAECGPN